MAGNLSEKDLKLLAAAWKCMEGDPKIDFVRLAGMMDYKNSDSVKTAWNRMKKKLAAATGDTFGSGSSEVPSPKTPTTPGGPAKSPRKKGTKDVATDEGEVDDEEDIVPRTEGKKAKGKPGPKPGTKKGAGGAKGKVAGKGAKRTRSESEGEGDGENEMATPTPKKKAIKKEKEEPEVMAKIEEDLDEELED